MTGRPEREAAINIYDLAKHLGISSGTVSRALNDRPEVSAATRERVLEAAAKLGFSPSPLARGLARNRSQTIGVIVPTSDDPFFLSFARGVQGAFGASGYSVVLSFADAPDSIAGASRSFVASRSAGILILGGSEVTDEKIAKIVGETPVVVALRKAQHAEFSSVFVDHEGGARAMVQLLLDRGNQNIAFVSLPLTSQAAHERLRGYRSVTKGADPAWTVVARGGKPLDGVEATVELMSRPGSEQLDAIFYASDALATGGLNSLFSKGIDVPADIAVAGFGDIDSSAVTVPPLTTVRVPMHDVGYRAGSLLLEAIEEGSAMTQDIELALELIERASTRS
ncbi:LacI family DNA-binding transcriptional regulator [Microbacterium azadirachtae]|uniref:Catabolite control protein A n=1 Tax=Microbacterium azadirachtae TaxID=582680 RepID=A0A0F0LPQ7_9MICO|nr:LacI family DNA-binding transcriptional regulator [Microbacterium azadirachtae]KJL35148.1 Catabolite control protein A [Microbacterium azadirachtae]